MPCHLPFLLPVAGLVLFAFLPFHVALGLYVLLMALSLAIAVPAARAMYRPPITGLEAMLGRQAVVLAATGLAGTVRCDGALWACCSSEALVPDQRVRIVAIRGLVVMVEPFPTGSAIEGRHP